MTTIELFTTTVDAVGMDTAFADKALCWLLMFVGFPILLIFLFNVVGTVQGRLSGCRYKVTWKSWVGTIVGLLVCFGPFLATDFSGYSEHALRRASVMPKHVDETSPGSDSKTIATAVHLSLIHI